MTKTVEYLTVSELAARCRVSVGTVYFWNRMGTGPERTKVGRSVLYRLDRVEQWEARSTVARAS